MDFLIFPRDGFMMREWLYTDSSQDVLAGLYIPSHVKISIKICTQEMYQGFSPIYPSSRQGMYIFYILITWVSGVPCGNILCMRSVWNEWTVLESLLVSASMPTKSPVPCHADHTTERLMWAWRWDSTPQACHICLNLGIIGCSAWLTRRASDVCQTVPTKKQRGWWC